VNRELVTKSEVQSLTKLLTWSLFAVGILLNFSFIPHEIAGPGHKLALPTFALIVLLAFRLKVHSQQTDFFDFSLLLLASWAFVRLTLLALPLGEYVDLQYAVAEVAPLFSIILLRRILAVDKSAHLLTGLSIGLLLQGAFALYQQKLGVRHLVNLGYVWPDFEYQTGPVSMRPFGGFHSPVTYGGFLAVALTGLLWQSSGKRMYAILTGGTTLIALTYTRSAWIAWILSVGIWFITKKTSQRLPKASVGIISVFGFLVLTIVSPGTLGNLLARLSTVGSTGYQSNAIRVSLWQGTLSLLHTSPWVGFGAQKFRETMVPIIGQLAEFGHPHNTFMFVAYEYGLIGFMILIMVLGAMFSTASFDFYGGWPKVISLVTVFIATSLFETTWGSFNFMLVSFMFVPRKLASKDAINEANSQIKYQIQSATM
jgi:O-antigen ligase